MSALVSHILTDNPCSLSTKSIPIFIAKRNGVMECNDAGYAENGHANDALAFYYQMQL